MTEPSQAQAMIFVIGNLATLGCAIGIVLLYWHSGKLIYQGTRIVKEDPSDRDWPFEEAHLEVPEGKTHVWFIPAEVDTKRTIFFSHGNAGNLGDKLQSIELFRNLGLNVLAYDYGGYGYSSGSTHEARMVDDIRATWKYAIEVLEIPREQMILHGRSMGGGPTTHLAAEERPGAVILESTFCTLPEIITGLYTWLPAWIFGRNKFDNLSIIEKVTSPILIIHGKDDTVIPFEHGQRLFEAAPEPKAFLRISGEHHEAFWKDADTYNRGMLNFIHEHLPPVADEPTR